MILNYTFNDHLHNYAVWTAARAVQRRFTTTKNIKSAIESTNLKNLATNNVVMTTDDFDNFHRLTANKIIESFSKMGIKASYGQAAKIIAVYIKTSIVIRDSGVGILSKIAHPPIDNILLTGLHKEFPSLIANGIRWTKLNEDDYFDLIQSLRQLNLDSFWKLETFWSPA